MNSATKPIDTLKIPIKDETGKLRFVQLDSLALADKAKDLDKKIASGAKKGLGLDRDRSKARFYIDTSDELEIAQLAGNLAAKQIKTTPAMAGQMENEVSKLAATLDPTLSSEIKIKLAKIIVSLLKGIRNARQTKEVLMREPSLGGLGLLEQKAEEIIKKVESKKAEFLNKIKGDKLEKDIKVSTGVKQEKIEDIYEAEANHSKLLTEVKPRDKTRSAASYRPGKAPEPVGPVEEMKFISMKDFRHLGKNSKESAQRIVQKIDLLGDESLELKAEAIKAWKASPVYQGYLDIGHKSMAGASSVEDIIRSKSVSDMTLEEFKAIADLNKKLRF